MQKFNRSIGDLSKSFRRETVNIRRTTTARLSSISALAMLGVALSFAPGLRAQSTNQPIPATQAFQ